MEGNGWYLDDFGPLSTFFLVIFSILITSFSVNRTPSNARRIAYRHFRSLCPTHVSCTSVQRESSTLGAFSCLILHVSRASKMPA